MLIKDSISQTLQRWTFIRALRLVVGLILIYEGIRAGNWGMTAIGVGFTLLPLMNVGCGTSTGCGVQTKRDVGQEISFEEIKNK